MTAIQTTRYVCNRCGASGSEHLAGWRSLTRYKFERVLSAGVNTASSSAHCETREGVDHLCPLCAYLFNNFLMGIEVPSNPKFTP